MRIKLSSTCFLLLGLGLIAAMPAHAVFKCVDDKGMTHYGDTMPPQCQKKEVKELSKTGSVIRKYDPPLTPEQIKARDEERARQADTARLRATQNQKDQALLATFGAEREFDSSRDRDITQLDGRIKTLKLRIAEIDAQLEKLTTEMQFYNSETGKESKGKPGKVEKSGEVPLRLTQAIERANGDRTGLNDEIAKVEADKLAVSARYETEKTRWKQLKSGMPPGTLVDPGAAAAAPASPTKAATAEKPAAKR